MIVYTVPPCETPWLLYRGYEGQALAEMELLWTDPDAPIFIPDVAVFLEDFLYRNFQMVLDSDWHYEIEDWWAYATAVIPKPPEVQVARHYVYRSVTELPTDVSTAYLVDRCIGSNVIAVIRKATVLPNCQDVIIDMMLSEGNGYRAGTWQSASAPALEKSRSAYGEHMREMDS
jgi:hypothetical protein